MQRLGIAWVPILFAMAGCVHKDIKPIEASATPAQAPPGAPSPEGANPAAAEVTKTPQALSDTDTNPAPASAAGAPTPSPSPRSAPGPKQARPPSSQSSPPVVKAPSSGTSALPANGAVANAATTPSAASPTGAVAAPALDLKTLEQRLRDTHAIGVFTKLSLKNQVDDLLAQFKSFYGGRSQLTLVQLRQKYEVLLLKVVSVLQNDDPQLASAISSSREAIWNVLADPKSFANI